jgi:hypothetical protein
VSRPELVVTETGGTLFVRMKSLHLVGVMALAVATVHSQPTNGPVYWSTVAPDFLLFNY